MRSESSGKTIKRISISKKHVLLYFEDDKLKVSKEAYVNSYLYVGKTLTKKELSDLKKMSELDKGLEYALSLLKSKPLTEWKVREKLYKKELDNKSIDSIIKFLKMNDLINDEAYIEDYLIEANEYGYGKHKILHKLSELGIFEEKLQKLKFPESKELAKAKKHLPNLERKYSSLNYESKKRHIYDALIRLGFESNVILEVLKNIKSINEKDELIKLKEDYLKIIKKIEHKPILDKYKRREYIVSRLLSKGYKYSNINKIMED